MKPARAKAFPSRASAPPASASAEASPDSPRQAPMGRPAPGEYARLRHDLDQFLRWLGREHRRSG